MAVAGGVDEYIGCTIRRKIYAIRRFCRRWLDGHALSLSLSLSKLQPSPATRLEANSKANQLRGRSEEAQQSICNGFLQNTAIRARVAGIAERGDGHVSGLRPYRCSALAAAALQRHPSPLPPQRRPMRARVARHRQCPGQPHEEEAEPAMASPVAVREGAGVAQDRGGGAHSVVGQARLGGAPPLGQERSSRARQRIRRPPVPRLLNRVLLGGHSRGKLSLPPPSIPT